MVGNKERTLKTYIRDHVSSRVLISRHCFCTWGYDFDMILCSDVHWVGISIVHLVMKSIWLRNG